MLFATDTTGAPTSVPGLQGLLRLDPRQLLPVTPTVAAPGTLHYPVPNDPAVHDLRRFVQALVGAFPARFTNEIGVILSPPRS